MVFPRTASILSLFSVLVVFSCVAGADTLELKNGKSLNGDYVGGSSSNVRFSVSGSTRSYSAAEIDALFLDDRGDGTRAGAPKKSGPVTGPADTMDLRSGDSVRGQFVGGSSNNVRFAIGGETIVFAVSDVEALFFDRSSKVATAAEPAPAPGKAVPPPAPKPVVIPAGSRIMVRNSQTIDSRQQQAGYRFTVRLESDLVAGSRVVAKRGSNAYGVLAGAKQSGRIAGRSELTLTLTDIMINNQMVPIVTSGVKSVTENTAGNTARKTLAAAAIGGLISGSSGAKTGAAVGAGASILTQGNSISIPSGTLLEFRLGQALQL